MLRANSIILTQVELGMLMVILGGLGLRPHDICVNKSRAEQDQGEDLTESRDSPAQEHHMPEGIR